MKKTLNRETAMPLTVNLDKLSAMLSCGHSTAKKVAEQAEARIIIGRRVLYSVDKVRDYLACIAE